MARYNPNAPTTISAAIHVLKHSRRPLTVDEVWDAIVKSGTWMPPLGGKSPKRTLAVQMARAAEGYKGTRPRATKLFRRDTAWRYELLKR